MLDWSSATNELIWHVIYGVTRDDYKLKSGGECVQRGFYSGGEIGTVRFWDHRKEPTDIHTRGVILRDFSPEGSRACCTIAARLASAPSQVQNNLPRSEKNQVRLSVATIGIYGLLIGLSFF